MVKSADKMKVQKDDIIVVGSGIAGLVCALSLAPRQVTLVTKTAGLAGGSSYWAKGGIAAAIGPEDSPEKHAKDTLAAGAGLSDPGRALALAKDGVSSLQLLIDEGVPFDRALDGTLALAREAAHKYARVVHAGGDSTGEILVSSLINRVRNSPTIQILESTFACDLAVNAGRIDGLITVSPDNGWVFHRTNRVVLATGGIGMVWWNTTNPKEATGDGLAMAARAGAKLADLEFMQFHPTALALGDGHDGASLPLLTEALRGAGALLVDRTGQRFMLTEHPSAELAPRDVVARAIHRRTANGEPVFLDLRPVLAAGKADMFPQALDAARAGGFDPESDLLPVTPAAHYHMGGVQTDQAGRTSIDGLWACGEVATTGIHGANRLASNSLLEGLVYAQRVAQDVHNSPTKGQIRRVDSPDIPSPHEHVGAEIMERVFIAARETMSDCVAIARSAGGLESALSTLSILEPELGKDRSVARESGHRSWGDSIRLREVQNVILVARLVALAALQREESRGAHHRDDFPDSSAEWQRRQRMTISSLGEVSHRP